MPKKKRAKTPVKIRRGWGINPKTQVTPSKKDYKRAEEKKIEKNWQDEAE